MSKKLELSATNIKALENGATVTLLPIKNRLNERIVTYYQDDYINNNCPVQKGDKDVWIAEDFGYDINKNIVYRHSNKKPIDLDHYWIDYSQMTKEQSRYSLKDETLDVKVVRVQELNFTTLDKIGIPIYHTDMNEPFDRFAEHYSNIMQENNINRTYENNDYVFLIEHKGIK